MQKAVIHSVNPLENSQHKINYQENSNNIYTKRSLTAQIQEPS